MRTPDRSAAAHKAWETRRQRAAEGPAPYVPSSLVPAGAFRALAPVIALRIVRDAAAPAPTQLLSPRDAYHLLRERFADADREVLVAVVLDTKNRVLAIHPVYYGSINSAVVRINEVFKAAIALGASGLIVAHNHPSGDPTPSPEDVAVTRQIVDAGKLLDIDVLDHLVLGDGRFVSLREMGMGFTAF